MQLSLRSRTTSISYVFPAEHGFLDQHPRRPARHRRRQPRSRNIRRGCRRFRRRCPPSVKDGRMMAGRPTRSSAFAASSRLCTTSLFGHSSPILVMASRNSSRSSALSIASALAPISSTPYFSRRPSRCSDIAVLSAVLAAHRRQDGVGLFLLDDSRHEVGRDRLDIGRIDQARIGHDRGRVRVDQDDPIPPRPSGPCRPGRRNSRTRRPDR